MCKEFSLITRYFNKLKRLRSDVEIGIGDDCAILNISSEQMLAVSTDTLVCGRHFMPNINPHDLAYKSLAVSISDLAAMGGDPTWLMLSLTLPKINENWLKSFSHTLFKELNYHKIQLIGGDTTSGPLSITLTIHGFVPYNCIIKRSGAKPGDFIYVTGTLGDSAAGLAILQNKLIINDINDKTYFINRHLRPKSRILHGQALRNIANSAIDISDGIISDIKHILRSSKVGAKINIDNLPLSKAMCKHINSKQALQWALSGGEDYELFFTVPESKLDKLNTALNSFGIPITCIGKILPKNEGLKFKKNNQQVTLNYKEYDHFI